MAGTLEYEQLNKNLEMVDGHAVKWWTAML